MTASFPFRRAVGVWWGVLATAASVVAVPAVASAQAGAAAGATTPVTPVVAETATTSPPLVGPRVQGDTLGPQDQAAGTTVPVSFGENFVATRLPFDVPFYVTGSVQPSVRRLELSVYRVSSSANLSALVTELQGTVDCAGTAPLGRRASFSVVSPGSAGGFSLLVNALDPDYYYAFCFVGVTPVDSRDIEADARRILVASLPGLATSGDITLTLLNAVRGAMRDRIIQLGAGRPVPAVIPPNNLFAARVTGIQPEFVRLVTTMSGALSNMGNADENYRTLLGNLLTQAAGPARTLLAPEVVAVLPPPVSRLPAAVDAIGGAPFDSGAFSFDAAKTLLEAAARNATAADRPALQTLVDGLSNLSRQAAAYGGLYETLRTASADFVRMVELEGRQVTVTLGSSVLTADLNRNAYVSLDAGLAYPWRLENMVFYAGTNIYFRPINKAASLRYRGSFLHRFAVTVGVTTTVKDDSRRVEDLRPTSGDTDTSNSLLLGGGIRVTPSMRISGGVLVFKERDSNPLIDQKSVVVTPYVALAADINVAQIFRGLF